MSDTNQELEIELEAEKPQEPEIKVEEAPKVEQPEGPTADEVVANLKAQLEAERAGRTAAEQRAQAEAAQRFQAENEVADSNLQTINSAIEVVRGQNANLKAQLSSAYRAQDFDAVAELQEAIAINASRLTQLENGKQAMEAQPKREVPKPVADPVEEIAAQLSPRSAQWVRAHPQYAQSQNKIRQMVSAHELALEAGHIVDTDAYFDAIETTLRLKKPAIQQSEDPDPTDVAAKVTQRRAAPAAAPVSRSGTAPGTRPNTIRLTRDEIEAAEISGLTPEQYARNKYALAKEGKMH